ncbi:DUF6715 family protein [Anaerocolumna sp.]|uniref:DUF6715 family protein n=1 Tax=Anaerocolumna sp. TaxID=2041569 RepID=UPI0028A7106C|nr:DUF6715 family protein [Anaerocolumna sp.]
MKKSKRRTANTFGMMLIFGIAIVAIYFKLSTSTSPIIERSSSNKTELELLLAKDIEKDYPSSPREVIKLYTRIMKSFYNEDLTDEQVNQLAKQIRYLYDDELLANNSYEDYLLELKVEITEYKNKKRNIMNETIEDSNKVNYYTKDGKECASLTAGYTIKEKDSYTKLYEDFILRKDEQGNWKIIGWKTSDKTGI